MPPPPNNPVPPMHLLDRLKQRVKQIRKKKKKYRVNGKKKAIKYVNKRNADMLLKRMKKQKNDASINQLDNTTEPYIVINKNISKKNKNLLDYRRKVKQRSLKILRANLKRKAENDLFDGLSDAETIPYAELYKNTFTKKDEIYRKKLRKRT